MASVSGAFTSCRREAVDQSSSGMRDPPPVLRVRDRYTVPVTRIRLAYDYPLLGVFWTLVLASLFFVVIFTIIWVFIDNFRCKDHGGWTKAGWFFFFSSSRHPGPSSISSRGPRRGRTRRAAPVPMIHPYGPASVAPYGDLGFGVGGSEREGCTEETEHGDHGGWYRRFSGRWRGACVGSASRGYDGRSPAGPSRYSTTRAVMLRS